MNNTPPKLGGVLFLRKPDITRAAKIILRISYGAGCDRKVNLEHMWSLRRYHICVPTRA